MPPRTDPLPEYTEEAWAALSKQRRSALRHREARLAYQREWAKNNREKRNEYRRKWIASNPEKFQATREREKNSEHYRERRKNWARSTYPRRRDAVIAKRAEYRRNNPEKVALSSRTFNFGKRGAEYYASKLEEQGGMCAICGIREKELGLSLGLDHDHRFPKKDERSWRGLLCRDCNTGIGAFKENTLLLGGKACAYLVHWARIISEREHEDASNHC